MYIEVFLLDNLLMDALILRLACALSARPCAFARVMVFTFPGVLYAWLSTQWHFLRLWPWALVCGLIMTFALPNGGSVRAYVTAWASVMLSAAIVGGTVFMLSFAFKPGLTNAGGSTYRSALFGVFAAVFLPNILRRKPQKRMYRMRVAYMGNVYALSACLDTGNTLRDSVSGRSVIVAHIPELNPSAHIPVPISTVKGSGVLYALSADMITLDGIPTDALLAICPEKLENALVPPAALNII